VDGLKNCTRLAEPSEFACDHCDEKHPDAGVIVQHWDNELRQRLGEVGLDGGRGGVAYRWAWGRFMAHPIWCMEQWDKAKEWGG
jgi:hypothetical protein